MAAYYYLIKKLKGVVYAPSPKISAPLDRAYGAYSGKSGADTEWYW